MDTKTVSQFSVMDTEMLAKVEGGDKVGAGEVVQALGVCTIGGAALGSVIPAVGTLAGGILGAQFCTAAWGAFRAS
ncbi:bacteriocin-like peptide N BlpN [Streptococcus pneumoniae]|uniref:Blp family class II bacteriocin n=1 Tax=Streptococcus pneumoniae TaxID=1313 RepID=UPI00102437F1|nr:Blp family class II bacteriocin [Streptococcus pneumoniae]VFH38898.1 bacteriocin-like peptide N BlpN [Streptococcus pneumoniae]VIP21978.1 bacteriocin-like peptide N BlpN [Streptococcus pneumoniae]VIP73491.1 bacteriocin-like peptide N BlpN [Streptococcus pneumoniae]VIQ23597.1 bacteriocin-like peptide N BlpN [Streptococcus pneumoniae]VIS80188.1 bacteriocin-like peptide N BlpN [Streptococcus pneumoniae]